MELSDPEFSEGSLAEQNLQASPVQEPEPRCVCGRDRDHHKTAFPLCVYRPAKGITTAQRGLRGNGQALCSHKAVYEHSWFCVSWAAWTEGYHC